MSHKSLASSPALKGGASARQNLVTEDDIKFALKNLRASVRALKEEYTLHDIENFVRVAYGEDTRTIICPPSNSECSQPSVRSL